MALNKVIQEYMTFWTVYNDSSRTALCKLLSYKENGRNEIQNLKISQLNKT